MVDHMENGLDLDAYFDRIQWGGGTSPKYETLAGVLRAHMLFIPFENLDVLLGRPIRLDLDGLQQKLVRARRGGYCFEHGTLFGAVLEEMGFKPVRHTARVVMITPRTAAPRTHMFLTVPVAEGTFVVDPGFGALAPRIPVPLQEGVEARIGPETHWMARDGPHWILRSRAAGKASDCWLSTLEEDNPVDFEMGSHYVATHPSSPFVNRMMMRALTADGRVTVVNRDVNIRCGDRDVPVQLADRSALRTLLTTYFGFDLPEVERMSVPSILEWR
jgi:N-hydroxyarylamine O-acetyltransferase